MICIVILLNIPTYVYICKHICMSVLIYFFLIFRNSHYLYIGLYFFLLLSCIACKLYFYIIYLFIPFFTFLETLSHWSFCSLISLPLYHISLFCFSIIKIYITHTLLGHLYELLFLFWFMNIFLLSRWEYLLNIYQHVPIILL